MKLKQLFCRHDWHYVDLHSTMGIVCSKCYKLAKPMEAVRLIEKLKLKPE